MQEENRLYYTFFDRLEKLRLGQGWSYDECAQHIGISKAMLFFMRSKKQGISKKSLFKLDAAERAAGLAPPEPVAPPPVEDQSKPTEPMAEALPAGALEEVRKELMEAIEALRADVSELKEMVKAQGGKWKDKK